MKEMTRMRLPFTTREIYRLFDHRYIKRGKAYFREGRVETARYHPGAGRITGEVRGSGRRRYRVHVAIGHKGDAIDLSGSCSCPVGRNCKHVVAVLFELLEEERLALQTPAGTPRDPVESWLFRVRDALKGEEGGSAAEGKRALRHALVYVIDEVPRMVAGRRERRLRVSVLVAYRLKSGGYGNNHPFGLMRLGSLISPPAYLQPADRDLLPLLYARAMMDPGRQPCLDGPGSGELLRRMLETGRCHWQEVNGPLLGVGAERDLEPDWEPPDDAGCQAPRLRADPPVDRLLPVDPPWYLDLERQVCGPARSSLPPTLLRQWIEAPPVPPDAVARVGAALAEAPVPLPPPATVELVEKEAPPLCPVLRLGRIRRDHWGQGWEYDPTPGGWGYEYRAVAWLHFEYEGLEVSPRDDRDELVKREGLRLRRFVRDFDAEKAALQRLARAGLKPPFWCREADRPPGILLAMGEGAEEELWMHFVLTEMASLEEEGWRVEIEAPFPYRIAEVDAWHVDIDATGDNQWFDLELGVEVEGRRISLLPILVQVLETHRDLLAGWRDLPEEHALLLELEDGRRLRLPTRRIGHILDVLVELYDPEALDDAGRLRVHRLRSRELTELGQGEGDLRWRGSEQLRAAARQLEALGRVRPKAAPRGFRTRLRPYQKEGLGWLQFLRQHGFNGVLADDMGLGKTVQTLAHVLREKREGRLDRPALVVAPTSLMFNWRREAEQFTPELSVLTLHGPERKGLFDEIPRHDLVLTTYPLLPRDEQSLRAHPFHLLILDEAQQIKNPRAKAGQVVRSLEARHRLCLTGTPLENHLGELWSLFDFLMPGLLGSERQFRRLFRTPVEKHGDQERAQRLARRVAPFLLRRDKEQVATDLPPKTEIVRSVPLKGKQRDLYETIRLAMHGKVRKAIAARGLARSQIVILEALLKLRQVCCDPRLLKMEAARKVRGSAKLDLLMGLLPELLEEGRRILLFSQFTSMLALIEEELAARRIGYLKLTGKTRDRETPIRRFQEGEIPLFLISLKAGGTGLNLTTADTVIHYDPWWNPAVENQATDRAHRIGQEKPVFVYRLLTEGTVEERIQALQARKRELAEGLFDRAGRGRLPGPDELEALFEPLG